MVSSKVACRLEDLGVEMGATMAQCVVSAFTSHQCGLRLTPGPGVNSVMHIESVVGFVLASKIFFGFSGFLLFSKCTTCELQFDHETLWTKSH